MSIFISWPSFMTKWVTIQNIYSGIYSNSYVNTHHNVIIFEVHEMVQPYPRWAFLGLITDWGEGKKYPFPKIYHRYPTMMKLGTVILYLRKIQKTNKFGDTPPEVFWRQHFFIKNQQLLLYFKGCFSTHCCKFDNVSKIGYSRSS